MKKFFFRQIWLTSDWFIHSDKYTADVMYILVTKSTHRWWVIHTYVRYTLDVWDYSPKWVRLILGTFDMYGMSTSLNKRVHTTRGDTYDADRSLILKHKYILWRIQVWKVCSTYFWVRRPYLCYLKNEIDYYPEERIFLSDTYAVHISESEDSTYDT